MRRVLPGVIALTVLACSPPPRRQVAASVERPVVLEAVRAEHFEADVRTREVRAARALFTRQNAALEAYGVDARLVASDGTTRARVEAPTGRAQIGGDTMRLEGGVVVTEPEGRRFETDAITYTPAGEHVVSDGAVRMLGAGFEATGQRLEGSLLEDRLRVTGPVRARILPQPKRSR